MAKKWNEFLLRSGVPLEYDVAKTVGEYGLHLHADYPFLRRYGKEWKECSVDLRATDIRNGKHSYGYDLLIECKYRSPEKTVLLLPNPNAQGPGVVGCCMARYDEFVPYTLRDTFYDWDSNFHFVYKAIELHGVGAVEKDFRSGIEQLRYATPAALSESLTWANDGAETDTFALFFAKILVTNAPLRVLHHDVDIDKLRKADSLQDVSDELEWAIYLSDFGPDYREHFVRAFQGFDDQLHATRMQKKYLRRMGKKVSKYGSCPVQFLGELQVGDRYEMRKPSSQFYVVNSLFLGAFIEKLLEVCHESYFKRKRYKKKS